jgi:hypothetical protein
MEGGEERRGRVAKALETGRGMAATYYNDPVGALAAGCWLLAAGWCWLTTDLRELEAPAPRSSSPPDLLAHQRLHRAHPRLAAPTPLDHALQSFQPVVAVCGE